MARAKIASSIHVVFLVMVLLSFNPAGAMEIANSEKKSWCVAKPSTNPEALQEIIKFVCHEIECKILNYDSPCFEPNNLLNHASVVMNLYYQRNGRNIWDCDFRGNGLISTKDPSYGSCKYE